MLLSSLGRDSGKSQRLSLDEERPFVRPQLRPYTGTMPWMEPPRHPSEDKIGRYDLRKVAFFHRLLERKPWLGIVLSVLSALAGSAMLSGWVGVSEIRSNPVARSWIGALLWWVFAAYVGFFSIRGVMRRPPDRDDND